MGNLKSLFGKAGRKIQSASTRETPSTNDNESNISITSIIENEDIYITNNNSDKTAFTERNGIIQEKGNHMKIKKNPKFCEDALLAGSIASTFASNTGSQLLADAIDDSKAIDDNIFKNFEYPFTNLVFEGGGNKGMAYVGALKVLEDAGIAKNIVRVAGSSVGAITASLFAVGFRAAELQVFMESDLKKVLVDHQCGYCSLLPNLLTGFGWNPGRRLLKWFGEKLREQTGDPDITFREVYTQFGCELCVVVTNLSQMSTEYFHPKTTPNTPIRTAVRMSTALPGVFQSVRYRTNDENTDVYVDGGLLCNYPIHAFDGWWLSMEPKDSFFLRLQPLEDYAQLFSKNQRFGNWSVNTLGIMLYSHSETELMKEKLAERLGNKGPNVPVNSKLYRKRRKVRIHQAAASQEHKAVVSAIGRFMKELHRLHYDLDGTISLKEISKVFETSTEFTIEDQVLLFGDSDIEEAFCELDRDSDGEVTFQELMSFVERKGVNIQTRFLGYTRREINSLGDFISTLQTALAINVKRNYVEDRDIERTIGIDTDYIEANDFYLEEIDKEFLLDSGAAAAKAFLHYYCKGHSGKRKRESALLSRDVSNTPRRPLKPDLHRKEEEQRKSSTYFDTISAETVVSSLSKASITSRINVTPEKTQADIHTHDKLNKPIRKDSIPTQLPSQIEEEIEESSENNPSRKDSEVSVISLVTFPTSIW